MSLIGKPARTGHCGKRKLGGGQEFDRALHTLTEHKGVRGHALRLLERPREMKHRKAGDIRKRPNADRLVKIGIDVFLHSP